MLFLGALVAISGCKKEDEEAEIPPLLELKTGADYIAADATVAQSTTIKVGIIATKTEDDLLTFNVSYAYDGSSSTTSQETVDITGAGKTLFEKDVTITTRGQAGTEKWFFTITDVDGNMVQEVITLEVN